MLARAHTFTIEGLQTRHVTVEVDIRPGLPAFTIVGLADAAVREARERVRTAIVNSGYEFPSCSAVCSCRETRWPGGSTRSPGSCH
jgi:magnesium chelatase family protein